MFPGAFCLAGYMHHPGAVAPTSRIAWIHPLYQAPCMLAQERLAMPHEYDDAIYADVIDVAIALTLELRSRRQSVALSVLAAEAVDALFCTCVTTAADAVAIGHAPVHSGLIDEVRRQAERRSLQREMDAEPADTVDRASQDSFPASDPPAWIWR